jgi:hypothetical protein
MSQWSILGIEGGQIGGILVWNKQQMRMAIFVSF